MILNNGYRKGLPNRSNKALGIPCLAISPTPAPSPSYTPTPGTFTFKGTSTSTKHQQAPSACKSADVILGPDVTVTALAGAEL